MATIHIPELSAASEFANNPALQSLLDKLNTANLTEINNQPPSPKKEENQEQVKPPQPSAASEPATPSPAPPPTQPEEPVSAVNRCCEAYNQAYKEEKKRGFSEYESKKEAKRCYLNKIPRLHKPENINDFIACITYAMLIDIIPPADGTKLLYAAQIATQAAQATHAQNKIANRNKSTVETPK